MKATDMQTQNRKTENATSDEDAIGGVNPDLIAEETVEFDEEEENEVDDDIINAVTESTVDSALATAGKYNIYAIRSNYNGWIEFISTLPGDHWRDNREEFGWGSEWVALGSALAGEVAAAAEAENPEESIYQLLAGLLR